MKNKKIFSSLLLVSTVALFAPILTSCTTKQEIVIEKYPSINLSSDNLPELLNYSASEWIDMLKKPSLYQMNNEFNLLMSELNSLINESNPSTDSLIDYNNFDNFNFKYNSSSPIRCSLCFNCRQDNKILEFEINNLFIFSKSYYKPPISNALSFNQEDMDDISNQNVENIPNNLWINSINSKYSKDHPNSTNLAIPPYIYELIQKTKRTNNIYQLTFSVQNQYKEQIDLLPNKSSFSNITVSIAISPYAGKELKTEFDLDQTVTNNIFNADFATVNSMSETDIYNKLDTYVNSLTNIQPLRNCLNIDNTVNGYLKVSNEFSSPKRINITFSSLTNVNYKYQFILQFNN